MRRPLFAIRPLASRTSVLLPGALKPLEVRGVDAVFEPAGVLAAQEAHELCLVVVAEHAGTTAPGWKPVSAGEPDAAGGGDRDSGAHDGREAVRLAPGHKHVWEPAELGRGLGSVNASAHSLLGRILRSWRRCGAE